MTFFDYIAPIKNRMLKILVYMKRTEYNFGRLCLVKINQIAAIPYKGEVHPLKGL